MKRVIALCFVVLAGCASQPDILPAPVYCQVPAGLLAPIPAPLKPQGDYTQRDVAEYLIALHRWGWIAWENITAIDEWVTEHCG